MIQQSGFFVGFFLAVVLGLCVAFDVGGGCCLVIECVVRLGLTLM